MDQTTYGKLYQQSVSHPIEYWQTQAGLLDWSVPYKTVAQSLNNKQWHTKWFYRGKLNASYNCIDRHLSQNADKTAIIWVSNDLTTELTISFAKLHQEVCQLANALTKMGVKKGDVVTIYLPMIPQAVYAMLACARIGAVHSVVFAGFSAQSLAVRINECQSKIVITANQSLRGTKVIPLKTIVDEALLECPGVEKTIVVKHTDQQLKLGKKEVWYHLFTKDMPITHQPIPMDSQDPLFILYTSGSTGKPKGIIHATGGYLVYVAATFKTVFGGNMHDIFWCTADLGWITGHSYGLYGALLSGVTTLLFEGVPNYPDWGTTTSVIKKHKVTIYYTAPTVIRSFMQAGDTWYKPMDSLRLLGSVGEPINDKAWQWYYTVFGRQQCPIVDTWWQTETGGILLASLPHKTFSKQPFMSVPLPAIVLQLVDPTNTSALHITKSWPGMFVGIVNDTQNLRHSYFTKQHHYITGDVAQLQDGYYRVTGRADDVLNVSGHRISTAQLEEAINTTPHVTESAVVGCNHAVTGTAIYAFVVTQNMSHHTINTQTKIRNQVALKIGHFVKPNTIQFVASLPKTRSGKILRRMLRAVANNKLDDIGDSTTLLDPSIIQGIINGRAAANQ